MRVPRQPAYHDPEPPPSSGPPARRGAGAWAWARRHWPRWPRWPRWVALGLAALLLACAAAGWLAARRLDGALETDVTTAEELARHEAERPPPAPGGAQNILLIGTGTGAAATATGVATGTVILLHLAGDRRAATAVSVPGDLPVDVPSCARRDGEGRTTARRAAFSRAYETGGAACTIRTLERLTRIRVDHHVIVDVAGFQHLIDAVGGVEMCLNSGRRTLSGKEALAYVRTGQDSGGGAGRVRRQQEVLAALAGKVTSEGLLADPARLLPALEAAAASVTTDTELGSLVRLYDLLGELRAIPPDRFRFLTVPAGRQEAGELFSLLRQDRPVPAPGGHGGAGGPAARGTGACET